MVKKERIKPNTNRNIVCFKWLVQAHFFYLLSGNIIFKSFKPRILTVSKMLMKKAVSKD